MILAIALTAVGAVACVLWAIHLAKSRGRNPVVWSIAVVVVGVGLLAVEQLLWTRPEGDAASAAGFDMQTLLPVIGMAGTALLMTYLPDLSSPSRDD